MNKIIIGAIVGGLAGLVFGGEKTKTEQNSLTPSKKDANNKKEGKKESSVETVTND
jgi:gas vesicle protein